MVDISNIKRDDIVAFKTLHGNWFTGCVFMIAENAIMINLNIPIEPQWYSDSDTTVYFLSDITDIVVLESKK